MLLEISHLSSPAFKHLGSERQQVPASLSSWKAGDPLHIKHLHSYSHISLLVSTRVSLKKISEPPDVTYLSPKETQFHFLFNHIFGVVPSLCCSRHTTRGQLQWELRNHVTSTVTLCTSPGKKTWYCCTFANQSFSGSQKNSKFGHIWGLKTISLQIKAGRVIFFQYR